MKVWFLMSLHIGVDYDPVNASNASVHLPFFAFTSSLV